MDKQFIVQTQGLYYYYSKDIQTLSNINLQIERGSIYGFLGPNGSGKTTTLCLLLGLLKNQKGSIKILGQHLEENREKILRKIGSLIETPSLYAHLTAKENLEVYRQVYGTSKARMEEVLQTVGLTGTGRKVVKKFSLGMKQRLSIALALLPCPELLVLDEPTNGLDPAGIIELRALLKKLNKEYGMTILISSHLLSEIEKVVTHVGIIYKGKMLYQGALDALQQESRILIHTSDNRTALSLLQQFEPRMEIDGLSLMYENPAQLAAINRMLTDNGLDVFRLQDQASNLEQLFINLTTTS